MSRIYPKTSQMQGLGLTNLLGGVMGSFNLDCTAQCIGSGDYSGCMNRCRQSKQDINVSGGGAGGGADADTGQKFDYMPWVIGGAAVIVGGTLIYFLTK